MHDSAVSRKQVKKAAHPPALSRGAGAHSPRRRAFAIFAAAAALYAALLAVIWNLCSTQARTKTEEMLDFAVMDFRDTVGGAIDSMVTYAGEALVRYFGAPQGRTIPQMQALAELCDMDEVNVVRRDGTIIASNLESDFGVYMPALEGAADFLILTNGVTHHYTQPFRASATNAKIRYKYAGVAFPGGNGFIQIGISEMHLARMFPIILGYIFDKWQIGKCGFFLCGDLRDDRLVSNPAHHRDQAETLTGTGFNPADMPDDAGRTTFREKLYGEQCYCRAFDFASHRIIAAVPRAEYFIWRDVVFAVLAVVLFLILGGFAVFAVRIAADASRLEGFYAAEESRRAKDMEIATTIQNSALPVRTPDSSNYELSAAMTAARNVGGDFYDYFPIDRTHVAFLVADVSGKGITGALYMMTAKTLLKDLLLAVRDPAIALTRANDELCRNNPANMFLTAWVGVLDLESGTVTYANAGHNPPVVLRDSGVEFVRPRSGPVLAFMPGFTYTAHKLQLPPGDALFLYTDGVTEAVDCNGSLFGDDRLIATLETVSSREAAAICLHVRTAVAAFSAGTAQADDLTVLAVRCNALVKHANRTFPATHEAIAVAAKYLDDSINAASCPAGTQPALGIILDEIVSNIVKFSGATGFEVDFERTVSPDGVRLVFIDDGIEYNPLAHSDPDTSLGADERQIGGLGILMVKKLADDISYRRERNRNILTVFKKIPSKK